MKPLYIFAIMAVGMTVVSCQRNREQPGDSQGKVKVVDLTPDELTRLPLLAPNQGRSLNEILVVGRGMGHTKSSSGELRIADSLVFGSVSESPQMLSGVATKAAGSDTEADRIVIYVVSDPASEGFTLVAKDRVLPQIVGYSDEGSFDRNNINPGFEIAMANQAAYLGYLRDSINNLRDSTYFAMLDKLGVSPNTKIGGDDNGVMPPGGAPTEPWVRFEMEVHRAWNELHYRYGPLLRTQWGQAYPYNSKLDGSPAGCTATAVAQIMAYYKYSNQGTRYRWDLFPTSIYYYWSDVAVESIGTLFQDLGSPANLDMSNKGAALCTRIPRTFEHMGYFGSGHRNYNYNDVYTNIKANRPVIICGDNGLVWPWYEGHTWVVDGVHQQTAYEQYYMVFYNAAGREVGRVLNSVTSKGTTSLVHHNFGWNSSCDAWLYSGSIPPSASQGSDIEHNLEIIPNIQPR